MKVSYFKKKVLFKFRDQIANCDFPNKLQQELLTSRDCFRCGTKPDMHGQFYENTVVVQYDKDLLEVWDEAKRLRCEWFNDYEKTASKPPMVIADLDVIQLDFRGKD